MSKFSKANRLLKKSEFDRAMNGGLRRATRHLVVIAKSNDGDSARLGLIVSKKVGNAVVRNKVKRQLREAFRHSLEKLSAMDIVVIARPSAHGQSFARLSQDFESAVSHVNNREDVPA